MNDRLAAIERDARRPKIEGVHAQTHRLLPLADVLALVEVAKAARDVLDYENAPSRSSLSRLRAALSALDGDEGTA